jgi:hypothetical protein
VFPEHTHGQYNRKGGTGPDHPPPPSRGEGGGATRGRGQGPRPQAATPKRLAPPPFPVLRYGGALLARCAHGPNLNRGHTENPPMTTAVSPRVVPQSP